MRVEVRDCPRAPIRDALSNESRSRLAARPLATSVAQPNVPLGGGTMCGYSYLKSFAPMADTQIVPGRRPGTERRKYQRCWS